MPVSEYAISTCVALARPQSAIDDVKAKNLFFFDPCGGLSSSIGPLFVPPAPGSGVPSTRSMVERIF